MTGPVARDALEPRDLYAAKEDAQRQAQHDTDDPPRQQPMPPLQI